ncbi:MAG TPA: hypothetical protein VHN13_12610 [Candidatus Tectomicrobia bacterium]|nr:hypothetical protein [Candidatus Tectomicrobia bacterium]
MHSRIRPAGWDGGTHPQAIRRCGLRWARYRGLAKTHPQRLITAVALKVARRGECLPSCTDPGDPPR